MNEIVARCKQIKARLYSRHQNCDRMNVNKDERLNKDLCIHEHVQLRVYNRFCRIVCGISTIHSVKPGNV